MKKLVLQLAVICSTALSAQTDTLSIQEFSEQLKPIETAIGQSFETKDYKTAENSLLDGVSLFHRLSEKTQRRNPQILSNFIYYNLACVYSLQNQKKKAVDAFAESVKYGYSDYAHAKVDSDLDNIRKEKRFVELMNNLAEKYDYVKVLQNSGKYQKENAQNSPKFIYESADADNLKNVREYFKLDSIAGNGDEISKILNLLRWVNKNIVHDGSNSANCEFDAIDLYNYHKSTGKGVNCRHLSTTLNEMYLALGIKSRFVVCLPKDSTDTDCHVINSVYSNDLKKWIWIDPSFNVYMKDENGSFLGIEEVRGRFINNQPVIISDEINHNGETYTKEDYKNYMAKNLYWLQCPAESKFNVESRYRKSSEIYVSLVPTGFDPFEKTYRKITNT
ncbi:MAG: transglutaminase-like domain-containing protein, partial [Flavobacteriaceae bacterium]|nr:transglutaminase-like domain-containing protein [Flavobacteriaceae bacterium]